MVKDNGLEYYESLPENYSLMNDLWELFKLTEPNGEKTLDNIEIRKDLKLIVYNPYTMEYYPRYLHYSSDRKQLEKYFKDENLYINKYDLIWKI
jgi:hypothetical protein